MKSPNISPEFVLQKRKEIGARLKEIREAKYLSHQYVADQIGLGAYTVGKIEDGRYNFDFELLIALSVALDFDVQLILKQ